MTICVTATNGGAGATVATAAIALVAPGGATLVDLDGDLAAALALASDGPGIADWLASNAPPDRLDELTAPVGRGVDLLPWAADAARRPGPGHTSGAPVSRWEGLFEWCRARHTGDRPVVVDLGHRHHPIGRTDRAGAPTNVVVTRACYLALRRWRHHDPPAGVVLVREPGRALTDDDVAAAIGAPVVASSSWDPAVARAVDAGLAARRLPASMRRVGRAVLDAVGTGGTDRSGAP